MCFMWGAMQMNCFRRSKYNKKVKTGEGGFVVMDIDAFERREKMLKLRENLHAVEEDRLHDEKGYSVGEAVEMMKNAIREAANG